MSRLVITQKGKTNEIDLTPVEEIRDNLERILRERENFMDRRHVGYSLEISEMIRKLSRAQLEYLTANLLGLLTKYADLYQSALDNPEKFLENMKEYKGLLKVARL